MPLFFPRSTPFDKKNPEITSITVVIKKTTIGIQGICISRGNISCGMIFTRSTREKIGDTFTCMTDLRKAHVNLDNVNKMRVKLAVQTLSSKVIKEMEECENEATEQTQHYLKMCEVFWNVLTTQLQLEQ